MALESGSAHEHESPDLLKHGGFQKNWVSTGFSRFQQCVGTINDFWICCTSYKYHKPSISHLYAISNSRLNSSGNCVVTPSCTGRFFQVKSTELYGGLPCDETMIQEGECGTANATLGCRDLGPRRRSLV